MAPLHQQETLETGQAEASEAWESPADAAGRRDRPIVRSILGSTHGRPFEHPLYWTSREGLTQVVAGLSLAESGILEIEGDGFDFRASHRLPWYLSTLKLEGFLGRLHARQWVARGWPPDLQHWTLKEVLCAALALDAPPGALAMELVSQSPTPEIPAGEAGSRALDALAADVAGIRAPGSTVSGEQPKFLARWHDGRQVLVKFTPPLRSPAGRRWKDLLYAEALAATVLNEHGIPAATAWMRETSQRAYLISERFDRILARGRRHGVSLGAACNGLVGDLPREWPDAADSLAGIGRLTETDRQRVHALHAFGRLIGNTDMHAGNISLFVERDAVAHGPLSRAPVYDMLPMIWRPRPLQGDGEYPPFAIDGRLLSSPLSGAARQFWAPLAELAGLSRSFRHVAAGMAARLSG